MRSAPDNRTEKVTAAMGAQAFKGQRAIRFCLSLRAAWVGLLVVGCPAGFIGPASEQHASSNTSSQPATSSVSTAPSSGAPTAAEPNYNVAIASPPSGTVINGIKQSGTGWRGNVNTPATSAQYEALSLDEILAKNSGLAQTLRKYPNVEAAIRQVSAETSVPDGLLAGVAYQESSFQADAMSHNPDPQPGDQNDVGLCQVPDGDFNDQSWRVPYTNLRDFSVKYFLPGFKQHNSWGASLRGWNSGDSNSNNLGQVNNGTDANYVVEILANHCMGLD